MTERTPEDVQHKDPEMWIEIERAMDIIIPEITEGILSVLDENPPGIAVAHSSFFKIEGDHNDIFYIELQLDFMKAQTLPVLVSLLQRIIFYDDEEAYNAARETVKLIGYKFPEK